MGDQIESARRRLSKRVSNNSNKSLGLSHRFLLILIHAVSLTTDKGLNCSVSGCRKMNDPNASLCMNDSGSVPQT